MAVDREFVYIVWRPLIRLDPKPAIPRTRPRLNGSLTKCIAKFETLPLPPQLHAASGIQEKGNGEDQPC